MFKLSGCGNVSLLLVEGLDGFSDVFYVYCFGLLVVMFVYVCLCVFDGVVLGEVFYFFVGMFL